MDNTTVKDKILEAVQRMPENVTFDEVMEQIYFLSKVEKGLKQVEEGDTISHEEVKKQKISDFFRESPLFGIELDLERNKSPNRNNLIE